MTIKLAPAPLAAAVVGCLCLAMLSVVGGSAFSAAAPASKTYAYTSEYYPGFGYTDSTIGVRKPTKLAVAGSSFVFLESRIAKPKTWKGWGSKKATARAKKQRICFEPGEGCSVSKKGRLKLTDRTKMVCVVDGAETTVWLYRTVTAKNPRSKGFPKGATHRSTNPEVCPSSF